MSVGMVSTSYIIRKHVIVKMKIKGRKIRQQQTKGEAIFTKQRRDKQKRDITLKKQLRSMS